MINYKTGIDAVFSGSIGTSHAIEQFYHDPKICDRKVVYIKDTTTVAFSPNARNVARITSFYIPGAFGIGSTFADGETITQTGTGKTAVVVGPQSGGTFLFVKSYQSGASQLGQYVGSGGGTFTPSNFAAQLDYGIIGASDSAPIRYRIDRDFQWAYEFASETPGNLLPTYSAPFSFASLTYDGSTPVVGTTGSNGVTLNIANKATHYWRGILDSVGDEWHTIAVAQDDTLNPDITPNYEYWASDGTVLMFVVNPKTPCLSVAVTGNAQFYTTPPKAYFVPRICDQTTYFNAGSGTITFTLRDINGNSIFWRIGGGAFTDAGSSSKTFTASDFSTGANTLQYYYAGNAAYTKTRIVVKNPAHPSLAESHGTNFLSTSDTWASVLARIADITTWANSTFAYLNATGSVNNRSFVENYFLLGNRYDYNSLGLVNGSYNCISGKKYGWDVVPAGSSHSYGWFAKTMLLDNPTSMDNVGLEKNTAGTGGYHSSIGTRENTIRGYYDMNALMDMAFMYDVVVAEYRDDQNAAGLTAIENCYVRDCLARSINEQIFFGNLGAPGDYPSEGMWDTARNCFALAACYVLPTYSSPVFGTCGLDGNTTTYLYNPFPAVGYTWKQIFLEGSLTKTSFPNYYRDLGIEESLILSDGSWSGKAGYCDFPEMGHAMLTAVNMAKIHGASRQFPNFMKWLKRCSNGTMFGHLEPDTEGTLGPVLPTGFNNRFTDSAAGAIYYGQNLGVYPNETNHAMQGGQVFGILWFDEPYGGKPGIPGNKLAAAA